MKKIIVVLIMLCSLFLIGCKSSDLPTDALILDESSDLKRLNNVESLSLEKKNENIEEDFLKSLYSFSALTFKEIYDENIIYSPISLYFALAMLYEGTVDRAREELNQLMGENRNLRYNLQLIYKNNFYTNKKGTNKIANSFWVNDRYEVDEAYSKILEKYYYAEAFKTTFNEDALQEICKWINHQTGNLLEMKPDDLQLNSETILALINTLYFNNQWLNEFEKEKIYEGVFNYNTKVTYLNHQITSGYYKSEICQVAYDYYCNGNQIMYIMPNEGVTIQKVLNGDIFSLINKVTRAKVNLTVPKFDIYSKLDLQEMLKKLGVKEIFNKYTTDITCVQGHNVYVDYVQQNARIVLDEKGTKAAAVTIIGEKNTSVGPDKIIEFKLDRPFIYVIFDSKNVPLFMGTVNKF